MVDASPTPNGKPSPNALSDDDISALLSEGRRTLPSQRKVEFVSADLPLVTEAEAAGTQLASLIGSARSVYKQIKGQAPMVQIVNGVEYARNFAEGMTRFISAMHNLPPDSANRHRAVGELLLPFAVSHWREYPPSDNGSLIMEYHFRENPPSEDGPPKETGSPWIKNVLQYFNLVQTGTNLPDLEKFLEASPSAKSQLKEIRQEVADLERKLASAREKLSKAHDNESEYDAISAQVTKLDRELTSSQQRLPQLFERVTDVRLANVPEVFSSLNIRLAPKDDICDTLCKVADSFERLTQYAALCIDKQVKGAMTLQVPLPTPDGKLAMQKITIGPDEMKAIVGNSEQFAGIVNALKAIRDLLSVTYQATSETLDLSSEHAERMKAALHMPLKHTDFKDIPLRKLIGHADPKLSFAAIGLLQTPIFPRPEATEAKSVLELPDSFAYLSMITEQYLGAAEPHASKLGAIFESQPRYSEAFGVMSRARTLITEKNIVDLAEFLNDQLIALQPDPQTFNTMGVLAILHGLTHHEQIVRELRFQMAKLPIAKELGKSLIKDAPEIQDLILDAVHDIVCTFSQSLRDYYSADKDGRLQEIVNEYRYYLRHPEIVAGIPVNHVLKNAIAVYGPPGVGKSFFAQCLANELDDIVLLTLSTGEKEPDQDQLAYIKGVFDKAKQSKSPVLLLIDEAETTVFYRMHPLSSPAERERTNYILQVVDEIRKSYGNIFLLIASNYPDRVDDAMERHGRVDLVVYLDNPGPEERESIIRDMLKKENVPLHPTAVEMTELVQLTDQFIPIQIIQAIAGTQRVYLPMMRQRGEQVEWSLDLLKDRFTLMASEDRIRKEKRKVMNRPVHIDDGAASVNERSTAKPDEAAS